jgi:L-asparaginase II
MPIDGIPLPVVEVSRNGSVESLHRGSIAVVDRAGNLVYSWGDPHFSTIMRSCAKPLQALPLIESGAADHFGLTDKEIAIATGSISGQDFQRKTVRSILEKVGLDESSLQCGTHRPFHAPTAEKLDREGKVPDILTNSCAGKHAGMLATCVFKKWPVETYIELGHPLQQIVLEKVSRFTEVPRVDIQTSVDGCGLPTFQIPLFNLALSFAKLTDENDSSIFRLIECARKHPEMIAGEKRICTDLIRVTNGRIFGKIGAEGVYGISFFENRWGIGLKIEDGGFRALAPTIIEVLKRLGAITKEQLRLLETYHHPTVLNYRKEVVGEIRPNFDLRESDGPGG